MQRKRADYNQDYNSTDSQFSTEEIGKKLCRIFYKLLQIYNSKNFK